MKANLKLILVAVLLSASSMAIAQQQPRVWNFSVLLDGSRIGYHSFRVSDESGVRQVRSEARFDVKFLFINAFRYRHYNTERWLDDCLIDLEASTNSNGKKIEISGEKTETGFVVEANSQENTLPRCVMTFAYWNPDFLQQSRLLNPQSGEYLDVTVQQLEPEQIDVRGQVVDAMVYNVQAEKMELTLWYSQEGEWLALESLAKGGRVIRYELT